MLRGRGGLVIAGTKGQRACEFTNGDILLGCGLAPWGNKGHRRPQSPLLWAAGQEGPPQSYAELCVNILLGLIFP